MSLELAWATGLFEGEGTIRINKATHRNKGHLCVSIVNTDITVVDFFQKRWPAYRKEATGLDYTRQRRAWVWVTAALKAAAFLREIEPFVVRPIVRERIRTALDFQAVKSMCRGNRTDEYAELQFNSYLWMSELNKRGVEADPNVLDILGKRAA